MNIVRCIQCGEIFDYEKRQICRGCGAAHVAEPAKKRPRQISPAQREGSADIDVSKNILIALVLAAGIGVAAAFFREIGPIGAFVAIALAVAVAISILKSMKKGGAATPDVRPTGPAYVGSSKSLGSSLEQGCGMVLKVVGIFIAVVVGLALLGILILWIVCMSSEWGHF